MDSREQVYLVLPLNVAAAMPEEVQADSHVIWTELEIYLREQNKELKTVARRTARALWLQSIERVRAGEKGRRAGYDDASQVLAIELVKHAEFDAMILPSLFARKAEISKQSANWDGVERPLDFEVRGTETAEEVSQIVLEGTAAAASLHIAIFDAKGRKLHEGLGGLEPLVRVRVLGEDSFGKPSYGFAVRSDLFQNRDHVREGIGAAFGRFLPPLRK